MSDTVETTPTQRLLSVLGAGSNQVRVQWSRTVEINRECSVTLDIDVDASTVSPRDEQYIADLIGIIDRYEALRAAANPPTRASVDDLLGIAPGWCDGIDPVDYVRAQRDR